MPNVAYKHKDYNRAKPEWDLVEDVLLGSARIKEQTTLYLPMPNKSDTSQANKDRYSMYLFRAVFVEITARTLVGLIGEVFSRPSVYELPPGLEPFEDNIDGAGTTLDQQSKRALRYALSLGRGGLLADAPKGMTDEQGNPRSSTVAELKSGKIRPKVLFYPPQDILNWGVSTYGAQTLLSLLVLEEEIESSKDGFEMVSKKQYRVLRLSDAQTYFVELWEEKAEGGDFQMIDSFIPTMSDGKNFDHIPFHFIGSVDNTMAVDPAPLAGMARLNLAHYLNSADYEYSVYTIGMPTAVVAGLTQQWIDENYPSKNIPLGSSVVMMLPAGGTADFLQAEPNTMAKEAMEHKEKLMVALGGKLVEQRDVQRTATEAGMDSASKTSVLGTAAQNVSFAYTSVLTDAERFVNAGTEEVEFSLNTEFDIAKMTAQDRAQLMSEWQSNGITTSEYRAKMTEAGVATLSDEDYKAELEEDALNDPMRDPLNPLNVDPLTGLPKVVKEELSPEDQKAMRDRNDPMKVAAAKKTAKKVAPKKK